MSASNRIVQQCLHRHLSDVAFVYRGGDRFGERGVQHAQCRSAGSAAGYGVVARPHEGPVHPGLVQRALCCNVPQCNRVGFRVRLQHRAGGQHHVFHAGLARRHGELRYAFGLHIEEHLVHARQGSR